MGPTDRYILFRDSVGYWCAAPPGFRNLVFDPTGWGRTREDAISALLAHPEFQDRLVVDGRPFPCPADFVEVTEPPGAQFESITYVSAISSFASMRC
jgi:hypothetical protein